MTGISLHMQWPLTSQLHGSVSHREQLFFFITDQTPCPYTTRSLPAQLWHRCTEWSTVWVSTKPLITEENWPGQGLNPGLPNDTQALYPLLHELMLRYLEELSFFCRSVWTSTPSWSPDQAPWPWAWDSRCRFHECPCLPKSFQATFHHSIFGLFLIQTLHAKININISVYRFINL
jgi:hypothetical protein